MNENGVLEASDGIRLFTQRWPAREPQGICLLAHGVGEHSGRYEYLARRLNECELSVWALDHRGHGRSEGRRGDCTKLARFVEDLHLLVERARREFPGLPRLMIGHSLGGLIALVYAVEHPEMIRGVAVSSPALKLAFAPSRFKVKLAQGLARILPRTSLPNGINPDWVCRDPERVRAYETDPLVHRVLTARCAVALREAMASSLTLAGKLRLPCLILQAGADRVCDPEAASEFSKRAGPHAVFRRYDGLYHELFNEPERDRVITDLIRWIRERL